MKIFLQKDSSKRKMKNFLRSSPLILLVHMVSLVALEPKVSLVNLAVQVALVLVGLVGGGRH